MAVFKIKASALYIVIIIALIIAIFSASLISTAYFYRLEHQKALRFSKLSTNLSSATAIALSKDFNGEAKLDLYGEGNDSVEVRSESWGIYEALTVQTFHGRDTLKKAFLSGFSLSDKTALYLSDEDRPLSVSGNTEITGEAFLPKPGIKQAYVEGRPYSGSKLVYGSIKNSERSLPEPDAAILSRIRSYLADTSGKASGGVDISQNSFFNTGRRIRLNRVYTLSGNYSGKLIIISDTLVKVSREANLQDVIIAAQSIVVEDGFKGACQLFASDSVVVGRNSVLSYPSAIGVIKPSSGKIQNKVQLGAGSVLEGIAFSYEATRSDLQTIVSLGKGSVVKGEVYAKGYIKMEKPISVHGKVSCNRFIIQTPTTLYENYLLDITVNRNKRSKYYLGSGLFQSGKFEKRVMKWLN